MVTRPPELIPDEAEQLLQKLVGQPCTLRRVGGDRSLFIGFGYVETTTTKPHASTEIGTYDCAWRVSQDGKVLCGRDDAVDDVSELEERLSRIDIGTFAAVSALSEFDIRIQFSTGVSLDILCTISDDDEVMHIFFPDKVVLTFQPVKGWQLGRSDEPWG